MATVSHPVATQATQTTVALLQPSSTHGSVEEGEDGVFGTLKTNTEEGVSVVKDQDKSMKVEQATGAGVESNTPLSIYSGRY